jgi:integrase
MPTDFLTDAQIRSAKPAAKPVRLFDGGGLYLEISPTGGKLWRLKYRFGVSPGTGKPKEKRLGLGIYPDTSLKDARRKRDDARKLLANGVDPSSARKAEKAARIGKTERAFERVAREWWMTKHVPDVSESHAARTLSRLQRDVFPYIGDQDIGDIIPPQLLEIAQRIIDRGAIESAHRTMYACGAAFRYGIAKGYCQSDPTRDLRDSLPTPLTTHMAAIVDPQRAAKLLLAMDSYRGGPIVRAALQLAALTFVRPGELRKAEWCEIDLTSGTWVIPPLRRKLKKQQKLTGQPHIVPLATQAVAILSELQRLTGHGVYVFPGARSHERPMSENAVLAALRSMGITAEEHSGHGFRALARTMLEERLHYPAHIVEAQLSHAVKDVHGRAYNRTEHIDQRREMMQRWADYLEQLRSSVSPKGTSNP